MAYVFKLCSLRVWLNVIVFFVAIEMVVLLLSAVRMHFPRWVFTSVKNFSISWSSSNWSSVEYDHGVDESSESFLSRYKVYCEQNLRPQPENMRLLRNDTRNANSSHLCDCLSSNLVGGYSINLTLVPEMGEMELSHVELSPGGTWAPDDCIPRQRIAVIIPFRDREEHLKALLYVLHPFLQRQLLHYTVFVVEQAEPEVFNKAMLMNVGFREATMLGPFDCYIFHDVDMLPEDDRNFYVCSRVPRHVGAFVDKWGYNIPYSGLFGGVTAFTKDQFEEINGFSNQYYGWGGEDDDMFKRIQAKNLVITRFPRSVARFNMIKHEADARNPYNIKSGLGWRYRPAHYAKDGVNALTYSRKSVELRPLYYWLSISLPPPPENFKSYSRKYRSYRSSNASLQKRNCLSDVCLVFIVLAIELIMPHLDFYHRN